MGSAINASFGAIGSGLQNEAQRRAAMARAGQDYANADLAERAGANAIARGDVVGEKANLRSGHAVAEGRQQYATSGVDTSSGSPLNVLGDAKMMGALDDMTIRNNAFRESMGYKVEAINSRRKGDYEINSQKDYLAKQVLTTSSGAAGILAGVYGADEAVNGYGNNSPVLRIGRSSEKTAGIDDWTGESMLAGVG